VQSVGLVVDGKSGETVLRLGRKRYRGEGEEYTPLGMVQGES